ncbi:adenylate/guanylate cyclase domain-containing protein [Pontibacter russatus]|uniref:adenylate/guanylate cyclase domain-containing protein n=1 Tax=Pontibacter russatus TaxID=2694929 RepID=UPI00137A1390|nr:adenylate/guanylate cyclase domain-containing protein [Pontibacter russatus]
MSKLLYVAIFLLIGSFRSLAQIGDPFVQNFPPSAYQSGAYVSSPQNWAIIQDDRGVLYISNTSGVLEYDGLSWRLVRGTALAGRFQFAKDSGGRIYAGSPDNLGYLAPDSLGRMQLVSLLPYLKGRYPEVRVSKVAAAGNKVYFSTENHIFCWTGKGFKVWSSKAGFTRVFSNQDRVYTIHKGKGLCVLDSGRFKALPGGGAFNSLNVTALLPLPASKGSGHNLFVVTYDQGLFIYEDGVLKKLPPSSDVLDGAYFMHGATLPDGTIALGTRYEGVIVVNRGGEVVQVIDKRKGLDDNAALYLYVDQEEGLWAALNKGISRIDYPSPVSYLNEASGLEGIVLDILKKENSLYAGTSSGLYRMEGGAASPRFRKHPDLQHEVWKLLEVGQDTLLVVSSQGVYALTGRGLKRFSPPADGTVYKTIHRSKTNPDKYYVGSSAGLAVLSRGKGRWRWEGTVRGIDHDVTWLAEDKTGLLWASGDDNISSVDISDRSAPLAPVRNLKPSPGLVKKLGTLQAASLNGHIYFGTSKGIYSIQREGGRYHLKPDATFGEQFADGSREAINLTQDRDGHIWLTSEFTTGLLKKNHGNTYSWDTVPMSRVPKVDVWEIHADADGVVWLATTEGIFRYNPHIPKNYNSREHTVLRKVALMGDSSVFYGAFAGDGAVTTAQSPRFRLVLPHAVRSISFEYTATSYEAPGQLLYSYMLEGEDEGWSHWTTETKKEFTGLDEGSYVFRVKSKDIYGTENLASAFAFESLPPFYRTWWAYGFYVLFYGFVIWGFIKIKHRNLIATKKSLEKLVYERTAQLAAEKKKSDDLLLNILPAETAEELKANGRARARSYQRVTVMFTDFKDFTSVSEHLTPEELVSVIDFYFCAFDRIISKYRIEKIKTIGDAYMCAGGMPDPEANTPADVVKAALEILQFVKSLNTDDKKLKRQKFEIRVGIHTGPVVAGIVGTTKFAYDIWGDTVNTAARMESSGVAGRVNISGATYELIKDEFRCTYRGKVDAKNKGDVDMYFVEAYVGDAVLQ